ncbi:MAG: hypothetical protein HYZ42_12370, partial [Bacteroidetes bacterium]|nr:hypothetical protein [Bacteroidota bacterium]
VTPWPASGNFKGTFAEAVVEILKQEEKILAYINAADESFFTAELHYKNLKGLEFSNTNFQVLQHMVNHSTMHRGQVITQMRQLGVQSILSTDLIAYYREKNQ